MEYSGEESPHFQLAQDGQGAHQQDPAASDIHESLGQAGPDIWGLNRPPHPPRHHRECGSLLSIYYVFLRPRRQTSSDAHIHIRENTHSDGGKVLTKTTSDLVTPKPFDPWSLVAHFF